MQIHRKNCKFPGLVSVYNEALRSRDMITKEADERSRILVFWANHGILATEEAFKVSRPTLFRWKHLLSSGNGRLESLNPKSTAPFHKRKRVISKQVESLIIKERRMEKIGKEKLSRLIKEDNLGVYSPSTIGRMLSDLKKKGSLPSGRKLSYYAKSDTWREKNNVKRRKLRSKGHAGGLVKADSIIRFTNGIKRYILTGIDLESEFAFAYAYTSHSSNTAVEFMKNFKQVAPISLTHIQTDNGSEFGNHFETYLDKQNIVHFHTYPRCPKMNAEIERFNRTISEAFISKNRHLLAYNLQEFNKNLMDWLVWYNTRRPHWSLGLISPMRYIVSNLTAQESQMLWTSTGY